MVEFGEMFSGLATPALRFQIVKTATAIIETETIIGIARLEIKPTKAAPRAEPIKVSKTSGDNFLKSIALCFKKGSVAPIDINVKPNIFVATATFGSTPN